MTLMIPLSAASVLVKTISTQTALHRSWMKSIAISTQVTPRARENTLHSSMTISVLTARPTVPITVKGISARKVTVYS